jgi:hypothetical protein
VHLTEQQIQRYKEIYQNVFGKEISKEKALAEGTKLVSLVQLVTSDADNKESIIN